MDNRTSRSGAVPHRPPVLVALAIALALLAAACSSDDGTEAGEFRSPISEFLGEESLFGFGGDQEAAQARFAEQERKQQEAIAACMKEQGFEYIPQQTTDFNFTETADGIAYDSREYAERYGFGYTTERFSQEEVGPELVGHDFAAFEEQAANDPNQAIIEAMDESTRLAYEEALWGDQSDLPSFDPETMTDEELEALDEGFENFIPEGCWGEAFAEDKTNAFFQEFNQEIQEVYESAQEDPRLKEREAELYACVADEGYDLPADKDINEAMSERYEDDLSAIDQELGDPGEGLTDEDFATMSPDEMEELFNQPRDFTPEAKAKLGELQAEETAIAVIFWDCGGSFEENQKLFAEVYAEYEQRFLDDNADRVEKYRADA